MGCSKKLGEKTHAVATILGRELRPLVEEWLRRINLVPALALRPLNNEDRAGYLPKLFHDLICRLSLPERTLPRISASAVAHGQKRRSQRYSPAMLVEESRVLQVVTFRTLHLHKGELDQNQLLLDIMVIADEVDLQLTQAMVGLTETKPAESAA
ncbi:MAG: hypothetical protein ABSD53_00055 [Terriglobales bacterium]